MSIDNDRYYHVSDSHLVRPFLRKPVFGLLVHWLFQSLLYMDTTERFFKIGLDIGMGLMFFVIFRLWFYVAIAIILAFLTAHSINFLFNGHVWAVLKHYGVVRTSRTVFLKRKEEIVEMIRSEPSIMLAVAYGSFSRGEWDELSDFDIRIVRKPGLWNGFRACSFNLLERTRALYHSFPLDSYILDSDKSLGKMRKDEDPVFLLGKDDNNKGSRI